MAKNMTHLFKVALCTIIALALAGSLTLLSGCSSGKSTDNAGKTSTEQTQKPDSSGNSPDKGSGDKSGTTDSNASSKKNTSIDENGTYTSKDEVALYIHTYGKLPSNYISKSKAKKAGWVAEKGNLDKVCPGKSIGGSVFYNEEGQLPDEKGREWHECDIDYSGGYRNDKRIVYSNDGLIYYTGDHYKHFEQLY